ncbi:hypothetical protein ACOSP7_002206 [Xanthoceras sorbifolium]
MAEAVTETPSLPVREDCWSEDDTATLIEAWGERYLDGNRRNLRQHHWQEVADAVNNRHELFRTDIQCKNRIDTVKKKYKVEKARVSESKGTYVSPWSLFQTLDGLFGSKFTKMSRPLPQTTTTTKRQVWAAAEDTEGPSVRKREREEYGEVAASIERLGEIYERVERRKQREMVGLEKQRMRFVKELECHRMKMLVESELQIQKMKRAAATATTDTKRSSASAPTALTSFMTYCFLINRDSF